MQDEARSAYRRRRQHRRHPRSVREAQVDDRLPWLQGDTGSGTHRLNGGQHSIIRGEAHLGIYESVPDHCTHAIATIDHDLRNIVIVQQDCQRAKGTLLLGLLHRLSLLCALGGATRAVLLPVCPRLPAPASANTTG
jgi:hypothetical protein